MTEPMATMSTPKDEAITFFLDWLTASGCDWEIQDHWEGDLAAVGICCPGDPGRLAYVSVFGQEPGNFYVELEETDASGEHYTSTRMENGLVLTDAVAMVTEHLSAAGIQK
jgi:hypothetical protein